MHIPDKILEKGGTHLDSYVKIKRDLVKVKNEISEIQNKVEGTFGNIEKLIGDYFKQENRLLNTIIIFVISKTKGMERLFAGMLIHYKMFMLQRSF